MTFAVRIKNPRYGMVVTDQTGLWMLIAKRWQDGDPRVTDGGQMVWWGWRMEYDRMELLLLDPDAFGEVV